MNSQVDDRDIIRPIETITAPAVNYCIYCCSTDGLTKEHVTPYFLAGALTLPRASCNKCSKITTQFETALSYTFFFALRRRFKVQSRSMGGSPTYRLITEVDGRNVERRVHFNQLPAVVPWPVFDRAGILVGREPSNTVKNVTVSFANVSDVVPGPQFDGKFSVDVDFNLFMRLMAKIAHGTFVARNHDQTWQPLLKEVVRFGQLLPFYVGSHIDGPISLPQSPAPDIEGRTVKPLQRFGSYQTRVLHDTGSEYLVTIIEPFSPALSPRYEVVTARRTIPGSAIFLNAGQMALPVPPKVPFKSQLWRLHIEAKKQA